MNERMRAIIAIIDDDPRILESLGDLLESAGYEVRVHSSAGSLLASDLSRIDCFITDIGMPEMNGFELRRELQRTHPQLPVLLISGRHDLSDDPQRKALREDEFFRKPFDGTALLVAIDAALQRRQR